MTEVTSSDQAMDQEAPPAQSAFKSNDTLSLWCVRICCLHIVLELAFAWHSFELYQLISSIGSFQTDADLAFAFERHDEIGVYVAFLYLAFFLLALILNSVWLYRTSVNNSLLNPNAAQISPGWTVGWFFVPIFNLWKPYQAVKELWNGALNPEEGLDAVAPTFFVFWWGSWIIANVLSRMSSRLYDSAQIESIQTSAVMDLVNAPIYILCTVLFIRIIRSISHAQSKQIRLYHSESVFS